MRIYALDTSGGMTTQMIKAALADIKKTADPQDIVVGFDTRVHNPTRVQDIESFVLQGGGGTLAQPVIDYAVSVGATGVIFYTDGWFNETKLDWKGIQYRECAMPSGLDAMSANTHDRMINDFGFQIVR